MNHSGHQDLLRYFKSFTSKGMIKTIQENPKVSRKEWMVNRFSPSVVTTQTMAWNDIDK